MILMAFSLRLLIMIPIAFRLYYLRKEYFSDNPPLSGTWAAIITQVDLAYAIISATIPCLRPFIAATATATAPTDGTRKGSRYAKGSREKSSSAGNAYGLGSLVGRFKGPKTEEKQLSTSTHELYRYENDHTAAVVSPGDQHSVESQESRQMIIRRDVEWSVTDEEPGHGQDSRKSDEGAVGTAI